LNLKKTINWGAGKFGYEVLKDETPKVQSIDNPSSHKPARPETTVPVHMFWAYGDFSKLERLAIASFLANHFQVNVWTYDSIRNIPKNTVQHDARKIIPEDRVFKYWNGSYAGFSDLFRYAVLSKQPGLWVDSDVICLCSVNDFKKYNKNDFLVTERTKQSTKLNGNVIYRPEPIEGDIIDLAYAISERYRIDKLEWGDCGPNLLTTLVRTYPKLAPTIMHPDFSNPINCWDCPKQLLSKPRRLTKKTWFLHCYNEGWRSRGIDKNRYYPQDSLLGSLYEKYHQWL
jgi:hypothetical protein